MHTCGRRLWHAPQRGLQRHLFFLAGAVTLGAFFFAVHIVMQDVPHTIKALDELYDPHVKGYSASGSNSTTTSRILLVSAFFPLPESKHAPEEYTAWLANFLGAITTPIYFYTPPTLYSTIVSARGGLPLRLNTSFPSAFSVPPLIGLEDKYVEMHAKDRERKIHNPSLYAVWNAKPWFLDAAVREARERGEEYDYAFWVDAGSFRGGHAYTAWPDAERVSAVFESDDTQAPGSPPQIFIPLAFPPPASARHWTSTFGPLDADITEGSFFGGRPAALTRFASSFYAFHNTHLARGKFVGKDQTLFNALLFMHPERFRAVLYRDPQAPARLASPTVYWGSGGAGLAGLVGTVLARVGLPGLDAGYLGACGGEWWYYQFFMAAREEREAMRRNWIRDAVGQRVWLGQWAWWEQRQGCRLTRAVAVGESEVLMEAFGKKWEAPQTV